MLKEFKEVKKGDLLHSTTDGISKLNLNKPVNEPKQPFYTSRPEELQMPDISPAKSVSGQNIPQRQTLRSAKKTPSETLQKLPQPHKRTQEKNPPNTHLKPELRHYDTPTKTHTTNQTKQYKPTPEPDTRPREQPLQKEMLKRPALTRPTQPKTEKKQVLSKDLVEQLAQQANVPEHHVYIDLAAQFAQNGNVDAARDLLLNAEEQFLKNTPATLTSTDDRAFIDTLAGFREQLGDYDAAADLFDQKYKRTQDPEDRAKQGLSLLKAGKNDLGLEKIIEALPALSKNKTFHEVKQALKKIELPDAPPPLESTNLEKEYLPQEDGFHKPHAIQDNGPIDNLAEPTPAPGEKRTLNPKELLNSMKLKDPASTYDTLKRELKESKQKVKTEIVRAYSFAVGNTPAHNYDAADMTAEGRNFMTEFIFNFYSHLQHSGIDPDLEKLTKDQLHTQAEKIVENLSIDDADIAHIFDYGDVPGLMIGLYNLFNKTYTEKTQAEITQKHISIDDEDDKKLIAQEHLKRQNRDYDLTSVKRTSDHLIEELLN